MDFTVPGVFSKINSTVNLAKLSRQIQDQARCGILKGA